MTLARAHLPFLVRPSVRADYYDKSVIADEEPGLGFFPPPFCVRVRACVDVETAVFLCVCEEEECLVMFGVSSSFLSSGRIYA